jgi:hypothetical protein
MNTETIKATAQNILDDRKGADYYQDTALLSEYLQNALGFQKDKADKLAQAIQDDRRGANYYQDVDILTGFLSGQ